MSRLGLKMKGQIKCLLDRFQFRTRQTTVGEPRLGIDGPAGLESAHLCQSEALPRLYLHIPFQTHSVWDCVSRD